MIVSVRRSARVALAAGILSLAACAGTAAPATAPLSSEPAFDGVPAADIARAALRRIGGAPAVLDVSAVVRVNMIEQSERPDGPWLAYESKVDALVDSSRSRAAYGMTTTMPALPEFNMGGAAEIRVFDDGSATRFAADPSQTWRGMPTAFLESATVVSTSTPAAVLSAALAAPDLGRGPDQVRHGRAHGALTFTADGRDWTVFVDPRSGLPSGFSQAFAARGDLMLSAWGDVVVDADYAFWWRSGDGRAFPRELRIRLNGQPWRHVDYVGVSFDPPADFAERLARPDPLPDAGAAFDPDAFPIAENAVEIADGVVTYEGGWNVSVVDQGDGLVVIEAPVSAGLTRTVLERIARDFPDRPIKAVVSTSDAWPHLAGAREYIARGIPVRHLDLNEPILRRLLAAPFTRIPDTLAEIGANAQLRVLADGEIIDGDVNDIVGLPFAGLATERMMALHIPDADLLYGSDALQFAGDGSILVHAKVYAEDLLRTACRADRLAGRAMAMHAAPVSTADLAKQLGLDPDDPCAAFD